MQEVSSHICVFFLEKKIGILDKRTLVKYLF